MSLFFLAGPAAYEMLYQNLPEALPSLSLVKKEMRKHYSNFTEGVFRFDKLSVHLDAYQAPRVISISEDATRIISRIEYEPTTDKLAGFVLPVDGFLPLTESFIATSFEKIEAMFHNEPRSTYAYVYVAQPMAPGVPPFCLNITGTNNRFDAKTVLSRWKHMLSECKLRNIHVISFSGDGDTQLLTSMRLSTQLYSYNSDAIPVKLRDPFSEELMKNISQKWITSKWFATERITQVSPVQDTVHLGVKLKARLLTYSGCCIWRITD